MQRAEPAEPEPDDPEADTAMRAWLERAKWGHGPARMTETPTPSLELVLRQQQRMLDEFADFRDQPTVLTAICMRVEASVTALTIEVRDRQLQSARLVPASYYYNICAPADGGRL